MSKVSVTNGSSTLLVDDNQVPQMLAAGFTVVPQTAEQGNNAAQNGVSSNPAKKALKGQNAEFDLSDPKARERFEATRAYNQQYAVGGIPPVLSAAFDPSNFEDGETIAQFEAKAGKLIEKEARKGGFYFAMRVNGEYNGQKWTALVLPGRGTLPQPDEIVNVKLMKREANASGLTLNVA